MRILIALAVSVSLFITGCEKPPEGNMNDNDSSDKFGLSVDKYDVYDGEVSIDIDPDDIDGPMLVTEKFTYKAKTEPVTLVFKSEERVGIEVNYDRPSAYLEEYADNGVEYKTNPVIKEIAPGLARFQVMKNGEIQNVVLETYDKEILVANAIGGSALESEATYLVISSEVEIKKGETADIEITRMNYYSSEATLPIAPDRFSFSLFDNFAQIGNIPEFAVAVNFPRPPSDIEIPDYWRLDEESDKKYEFSVKPHIAHESDEAAKFHFEHFRKVLADSVNFRDAPEPDYPKVEGKETLKAGEKVELGMVLGDWYQVTTEDGYYGWVRWRYEDPDTGQVNIYVEEFKIPY